ncbi:uncharacterized protein FA14DRAFT_51436 [Meira miltonrushii]|uniref:DUF676 domain-containing protein n=1 Tax=Meira miltonrushii TaxID=1280837 RepID=A0A316VEW2_9BASI|nr:uncharacterized protein FA14DRAFT_51436 [Meira miltonrushii]PWN36066.1 hypothetical protein FA14DRAFT_51436 [Meira miltonrushii]
MAPSYTSTAAAQAKQHTLKKPKGSTNDITANPNLTPGVIGKSPLMLFASDVWLFFTLVIPKIYNVFLPLRSFGSIFQDITPTGLLFQVFLTVYSLVLLIPLGLLGILVGGITPFAVASALLFPFQWIQGDTIVHVPVNRSTLRGQALASVQKRAKTKTGRDRSSSTNTANEYPNTFNNHAWFFINGISTSRSGIVTDLRFLEKIFQRPITGIFNRTAGPILDVFECVIQRDFSYYTRDIRNGYVELRAALEADNTKKVVLLCHSQGGIIASLIVDLLLSTISRSLLDKLEVYTFADASNHFNNPLNAVGQPTIRYVEHFANGKDPISQFGVLLFTTEDQKKGLSYRKSVKGTCSILHFDDNQFKIATNNRLDDLLVSTALTSESGKDGTTLSTIEPRSQVNILSAAGQVFSGRLFARWQNSGHLLINHYLGPDNNIMDTPEVRQYSRLYQYLNGRSPSE